MLAGVHGCEYASMAGLRTWARSLAGRELSGHVLAVPVLNLPAFRARTPFVVPDDGKNLNRCFPGNAAGSLAERLAYDTFTKIIRGSDVLIDMHAGDLVEALQPFALYDAGPGEARALEVASAYGLGYVIRQEPGPDRAVAGTSSAAAAEIGIPAIIAEAGGCGLVERPAVEAHVRGLNRVLALLGMSQGPFRDDGPPPGTARSPWARSPPRRPRRGCRLRAGRVTGLQPVRAEVHEGGQHPARPDRCGQRSRRQAVLEADHVTVRRETPAEKLGRGRGVVALGGHRGPRQGGGEAIRQHRSGLHREVLDRPADGQAPPVDGLDMGAIGIAEENVMTGPDQVGTDGAADGTGADYRQLHEGSSGPALTAGYAQEAAGSLGAGHMDRRAGPGDDGSQ